MELTVVEASKKHCPLLQRNCAGSECMMWRWAVRKDAVGGYAYGTLDTRLKIGYCGIAGKPDKYHAEE